MNARKAKHIKGKALEFSRTAFGRDHHLTVKQTKRALKKMWLETPSKLKGNFFKT